MEKKPHQEHLRAYLPYSKSAAEEKKKPALSRVSDVNKKRARLITLITSRPVVLL
jgi:hypothetical protein